MAWCQIGVEPHITKLCELSPQHAFVEFRSSIFMNFITVTTLLMQICTIYQYFKFRGKEQTKCYMLKFSIYYEWPQLPCTHQVLSITRYGHTEYMCCMTSVFVLSTLPTSRDDLQLFTRGYVPWKQGYQSRFQIQSPEHLNVLCISC